VQIKIMKMLLTTIITYIVVLWFKYVLSRAVKQKTYREWELILSAGGDYCFLIALA